MTEVRVALATAPSEDTAADEPLWGWEVTAVEASGSVRVGLWPVLWLLVCSHSEVESF